MSIFEGLRPREGTGSQLDKELAQLASSLMTKSDIELKTEIGNPLAIARLRAFGAWSEKEGLIGIEELTNNFIDKYLEYMVSYKRQGRGEVVRAISEMKKREVQKTLLGDRDVDQ